MNRKQKRTLIRIIITAIIFIVLLAFEHTGLLDNIQPHFLLIFIYLVPYIIIGYDVIKKAAINISHGQVFDENFLMLIATFGAFGVSEYSEAVAVMLFYQVGELFQSYAVGKSRQSISDMMDICPKYANIEEDGVLRQVDPDDVEVGAEIIIKPGEKIPLDGEVIDGESMVDTAALTGESLPRKACKGDSVLSGCVNGSNTLRVKVTKVFEDSTVAKILELVENASSQKAKTENFITRFAKYYTPIVTVAALCLAIIPPLIFHGDWGDWIKRACIFLVISCPCALVISVPLGFFGGIGAASKIGVLIKGSNYLETASKISTIMFDKTGTLTKGEFKVNSIIPTDSTEDELLELAAYGENYSNHPIADALKTAYARPLDLSRIGKAEEIAGHGIHTQIDSREVYIGNAEMMRKNNIEFEECDLYGTIVYIAVDGKFKGAIVISDSIKDGTAQAIQDIKDNGVKKCVMLTGDREKSAEMVAETLKLDEYHAELLPADKVNLVKKSIDEKQKNECVAFVGDGINDAPVLTMSDIGIAMGSLGSDAAIEAADIVIMDDNIEKIPSVIRISRKTMRIVLENIVLALAVKAIVLVLGSLGEANMWEAVFADVGVSVIAIINSMRALKIKK